MKRVSKGFSGRVTPLFPKIVVQNQAELGEGSSMPTDPHHTPTIIESSTQPQKTQKPMKPKRKDTQVPQPSGPTDIVADEGRRINAIDADDEITLVNVQDDDDEKMFDVDTLNDEEVFVAEQEVAAKDVNLTIDEVTLAQAFASLKSVNPKVKGDVIKEPSVPVSAASAPTKVINVQDDVDAKMFDVDTLNDKEVFFAEQEVAAKDVNLTVDEVTLAQALVCAATTTTSTIPTPRKGIVITELGKLIKPEPVKPTKKKVQIMLDEEIALKLQAMIDEEERIARSKEEKINEANIVWDEIQAKVNADYQLAERLQAEEQEQFTIYEKATLGGF
ncbi:hypothetical protein Tco_0103916 [Tanacetum coccineum]